MSAACVCPEVPAPDHVGAGPIVCACCGKPLRLTCPGECGEQHVRQSIRRAIAKPAAPPAVRSRASRASRVCTRCGRDVFSTGGRVPKYHAECRTPAELERLRKKTEANARARHLAKEG